MTRNRTRIVLVGCGGISTAWLEAVSGNGGAEIVGLVDLNKKRAGKTAQKFNLVDVPTGADFKAMLEKTSPDVVFDCTVPEAHTAVTLTALKHGCHVLGEKPLADSMANARKMVKAAGESGKIYAVMQNYRYAPDIRALCRFIESGAIGRVTTVHSDFFIGAHFGGFRDRMRHVLLLDMAIHTYDAARLITGEDPVSVLCHEWNPHGSWYDHDASTVAIFEMTNGVVYCYRGSWCAEGLNTTWSGDWRIIGEEGSVLWNGGDEFKVEVAKRSGGFFTEKKRLKVPRRCREKKTGDHYGIIREFIECVQRGGAPETICTDNIKSLAMVHAAVESAAKDRKVIIRY